MSQAEGPEPQVGRSVGDTAQAVLDGVDGLMHCHVPKVKLHDRSESLKCDRRNGNHLSQSRS